MEHHEVNTGDACGMEWTLITCSEHLKAARLFLVFGYAHQRQIYKSFTDTEGVSGTIQVLHDPQVNLP